MSITTSSMNVVYGSHGTGNKEGHSSQHNDPNLHNHHQSTGMPTTDYIINVKTSDRFGAGTDANVYVQLHGESGLGSEPILLKSSQNRNKFERNQYDQFTFTDQPSVGQLKSIKIWHDNAGIGASWHLEHVEISDTGSGQKYRFPCHRWLSTNEEDGQISRELKCTEVSAGPKHTIQTATGILKNSTSVKPDLTTGSTTTIITSSSSSSASTASIATVNKDDSDSQDRSGLAQKFTSFGISNCATNTSSGSGTASTVTTTSAASQIQPTHYSAYSGSGGPGRNGGGSRHNSPPSNNDSSHHYNNSHHQRHHYKPSSLIQAHNKVEVFSQKPDSRKSSCSSVTSTTTSTGSGGGGGGGSMYGPFFTTGNSNYGSSTTISSSLAMGVQQPVRKSSNNSMYGPYSNR